jgi:hypothetical protein
MRTSPRPCGRLTRSSRSDGDEDGLPRVPTYFFHLFGRIPARDVTGHECTNDDEAKEHGSFIAHRIGTEKPEMVLDGNFISVENQRSEEIARIPLASTNA